MGFFSLLLVLGLDALTDSRVWVIIWIAGVALWGVCTTMTLSERLENATEYNHRLKSEIKRIENEKV